MDKYVGINDGANYSLPIALSEHEQEDLKKAGLLETVLREYNARDTMRFQFDTPQRSASDMPILPTIEDPLKEWLWATRLQVLSNCHSVYERNPLVHAAVNYTADYVIGDGFSLTCKNHELTEFLQAFIDNTDNAIREYERQAVIGLQVDGELFLRYFVSGGEVVVVPLRPWECQGIMTEMGFFRRPEKYRFQFQRRAGDAPDSRYETKLEFLPADEILHVAINRGAYELRGRPELFRILPYARADKEFLDNTARQNYWRSALLWFVKVANVTAAQLAAVVARWAKPPTPGSVVVEGANVDVQPLTNSGSSAAATEDGRQLKLRVIMGFRLPEYMFADGYNANLATATAQSLPALTRFTAFQTIMIEQLWYPLFTKVIETAINAGLLPPEMTVEDAEGETVYEEDGKTPQVIDTLKAFEVSYSPVFSSDKLQLANALTIAEQNGWQSRETSQIEFGLDPALENKRIDREKEAERTRAAQGKSAVSPDDMEDPTQKGDKAASDGATMDNEPEDKPEDEAA